VTVEKDLLEEVERAQGRQVRSRFVEHLLKLGLNRHIEDRRGGSILDVEKRCFPRKKPKTLRTKSAYQ